MLYIILWLLCGLVAGAIYHNKGRPYVTAFLVGLIFGPIGIVLAAITPADAAGQERRALAAGQQKCPHCASLVPAEATVCRYCQRPLK